MEQVINSSDNDIIELYLLINWGTFTENLQDVSSIN